MCTLMRFKYDRIYNRKSKVFADVNYELRVRLPVQGKPSSQIQEVTYSLYAIVVHSGYSSDSGHYYTYAKVPKTGDSTNELDSSNDKGNVWYKFNDTKVTYSSFESFLNLSEKNPIDTAYVLFYQKDDINWVEQSDSVVNT